MTWLYRYRALSKTCVAIIAGLALGMPIFAHAQLQGNFINLPMPHLFHPKNVDLPAPLPSYTVLAPKLMTLKEAVFLALRNNPDVRNAELQRIVDKFSLAVAYNQFEPQYSLTGQTVFSTGASPTYSVLPTVNLTTPYGTQFSASVNETLDGSALGTLTVTQPLLRGTGRQVVEAQLYIAQQTDKLNKLKLKSQAQSTIVQVVQAYTTVVQDYMNVNINQLALQGSRDTLFQTQMKIAAGKEAEADQVQQQANVASQALSLEQSKNSLVQDLKSLLIILGLNPNANVTTEKTITVPTTELPTLDQSIHLALANNIDYQNALINMKVAERNLVTAKDAQRWQLNATASMSRDLGSAGDTSSTSSTVTTTTATGVTQTVTTIGGLSTTKSLTLNLDVPIDNLPIQQQVVNARIGLQQAKISLENSKRQLEVTVMNAYQNLQSIKQQIVLAQNQVTYAQQSLQVAQIKFSYGKTTSFELTSLSTALQQAQTTLVSQEITYINALEQFFQTLGTTLDKWKIIVDY